MLFDVESDGGVTSRVHTFFKMASREGDGVLTGEEFDLFFDFLDI